MLSIFGKALTIATRTDGWNAPSHWTRPARHPVSDREAARIDEERRRLMHYRAPW